MREKKREKVIEIISSTAYFQYDWIDKVLEWKEETEKNDEPLKRQNVNDIRVINARARDWA